MAKVNTAAATAIAAGPLPLPQQPQPQSRGRRHCRNRHRRGAAATAAAATAATAGPPPPSLPPAWGTQLVHQKDAALQHQTNRSGDLGEQHDLEAWKGAVWMRTPGPPGGLAGKPLSYSEKVLRL
mmetsp:Transcript_44122/g.78022  ORF Transcript_44122/g.78022 Transcript_44122/m.78022 type:complete len:125 (-) Transcript_44122:31-405(-)